MQAIINVTRLHAAISETAAEIATMIRGTPHGRKQVPRSQWRVDETAAHLAIAQKGMADIATGAIPNPYERARVDDFAAINARYLEMFTERNTSTLADLIHERTREFLETLGRLPESQRVPSPFGEMEVATLYTYNLAHLLMHGQPLSEALGQPSPVSRERVFLAVPFLHEVMPKVYDGSASPGFRGHFEIRLRGGPRFSVVFENGACRVENSGSSNADCHISADPVAFFLVSAGVVPQWGPIARGKMIAWGRKPWMAFRLKSLLPNP